MSGDKKISADGVINSVAYRDGKRLADIDLDDISDVIKEPNTFVWVGLHEPEPALLQKMQEEFGLHDLAIEDARDAHQRPKIETYGDSLFIVVKTAEIIDEQVEYGETHFFVGTNFLISVRHGCSQGYIRVRDRCEDLPQMLAKGPGFALYALLDFIVDNYQPIVTGFEAEFDVLESDIFKGQFDNLALERLYDLKIKLMGLRNAVVPIEDVCMQLMRFHPELIPKDVRAYFRDIHDHVVRISEALDNLREMLTTAMQVNLALVTVRQNEVVKRLAGWGAILAVPTVVFSLYGMNFKAMPELDWSFGYPVAVSSTLIGCGLLYRKLKRSSWL
ncbi:MAG TPA: magnesium/cobalt transporter CorA [Spongiibacteraceae bacterium]|nr:magnesium/cobalt transporter CorA [Spongiibacteraceae bacterium]